MWPRAHPKKNSRMGSGAEAPPDSQRAARRGGGVRAEEGRRGGARNGHGRGKDRQFLMSVLAMGEERQRLHLWAHVLNEDGGSGIEVGKQGNVLGVPLIAAMLKVTTEQKNVSRRDLNLHRRA